MGITLNIDSDVACLMASRLSALTGERLTRAVTEVIRERLDRRTLQSGTFGVKERLKALAAEIAAHLQEPASSDHSWLYDDVGVPR
jgi:hypothetical protein